MAQCRACVWASAVLLMSVAGYTQGETASVATEMDSHLGNRGPAFEAGMTPSKLGWGGDDQPYPERFVVNPTDGAEMVWVPAGTFRMGSTQEETDALWLGNGWDPEVKQFAGNERPAHAVMLTRGFWLYRHEVMNGQYARFLAATGHEAHEQWDSYKAHERLPANWMNWNDASDYAEWASGTLPTEAEWEYAARGPEGRPYPWGGQWDRERCNSAEYWAGKPLNTDAACKAWLDAEVGGEVPAARTIAHLREVGSFPSGASWCGALDLAGSVYEWCGDWYGDGYYATSPAEDPSGPVTGRDRVVRGGSWHGNAYYCRAAYRCGVDPANRLRSFGFRVARIP